MARLVVVDFDDNAQADAFIDKLKGKKSFRVVGLFARPTSWCECPKPTGYAKNEVVLGGRYGWWIHRLCRKPRRGTHQANNLMRPLPISTAKYTTIVNQVCLFEVPSKNLLAAQVVD